MVLSGIPLSGAPRLCVDMVQGMCGQVGSWLDVEGAAAAVGCVRLHCTICVALDGQPAAWHVSGGAPWPIDQHSHVHSPSVHLLSSLSPSLGAVVSRAEVGHGTAILSTNVSPSRWELGPLR